MRSKILQRLLGVAAMVRTAQARHTPCASARAAPPALLTHAQLQRCRFATSAPAQWAFKYPTLKRGKPPKPHRCRHPKKTFDKSKYRCVCLPGTYRPKRGKCRRCACISCKCKMCPEDYERLERER